MLRYTLSATAFIECVSMMNIRRPSLLPTTFFAFFSHTKERKQFNVKTVHQDFNCSINEVYGPFKRRSFPVQTISFLVPGNDTNSTKHAQPWCQGPSLSPNEFHMLSDNTILLRPHQKIYPNDSYILVNRTLILCSNFSRNYTKQIDTAIEKEKPRR